MTVESLMFYRSIFEEHIMSVEDMPFILARDAHRIQGTCLAGGGIFSPPHFTGSARQIYEAQWGKRPRTPCPCPSKGDFLKRGARRPAFNSDLGAQKCWMKVFQKPRSHLHLKKRAQHESQTPLEILFPAEPYSLASFCARAHKRSPLRSGATSAKATIQ